MREFIIDFNACSAYSKYCEYYTLPALFTSQWREDGRKTTTLNWDILLSLAPMPSNDEWLWDSFLFFSFYCFGVQSNLLTRHCGTWHCACLHEFRWMISIQSKEKLNREKKHNISFCSICSTFFSRKFRVSIYHFVVVVKLKIETFRAR